MFELILTASGGAELVEHGGKADGQTVWASDADEDFREEFPDLLDENDAAAVFDYLVEGGYLDDDEADEAELSIEELQGNGVAAPVEGELITADEWDDRRPEDDGHR